MMNFLFILPFLVVTAYGLCPKECRCNMTFGKPTVICDSGGLTKIPLAEIGHITKLLIITAPSNKPNNLTIGRIFMQHRHLEEIRITHSNIPAIGDTSFFPGWGIRVIDLSHNNLTFLHASDFNGLKDLEELDLSDNNISATPSAPFRFLSKLITLSLARNQLETIPPRFFYLIPELKYLDLSGNPLRAIDPKTLQDVRNLRTLRLENCSLFKINPLVYKQLPNLQNLDLRNNYLTSLSRFDFRPLLSLRVLLIDGNRLTKVQERVFHGLRLWKLSLSRNMISSVDPCGFCNSSATHLDLSQNQLTTVNSVLAPLGTTIKSLNVSFNKLSGKEVVSMIKGLSHLENLDLYGLQMTSLPHNAFFGNSNLRVLNMSHNKLENISYLVFQPLVTLKLLDLSHNEFPGLHMRVLEQITSMESLSVFLLNDNPLSCTQCNILPLLVWTNRSSLYKSMCGRHTNIGCIHCSYPISFQGRELNSFEVDELQPCVIPITESRVMVMTSEVGLIVATTIVLILFMAVLLVIILYRRQGAVYYTHEDGTIPNGMYEHLSADDVNGCSDEKKTVFFTNPDRTNDIKEEKSLTKHG